jgi:hypothetical protein
MGKINNTKKKIKNSLKIIYYIKKKIQIYKYLFLLYLIILIKIYYININEKKFFSIFFFFFFIRQLLRNLYSSFYNQEFL